MNNAALSAPNDEQGKPAIFFLNYPGDLRGRIEGEIVGPNLFKEYFVICSTKYTFGKDITKAGLRFATIHDLQESRNT